MSIRKHISLLLMLLSIAAYCMAGTYTLTGRVVCKSNGLPIQNVLVSIEKLNIKTSTDSFGIFNFYEVPAGTYKLHIKSAFFERYALDFTLSQNTTLEDITIKPKAVELAEVTVDNKQIGFGIARLKTIEGTAVYDGKKNEVIVMNQMNISLATNSSRQIFSKVPGINIWESDAGGIQLGVAARGLDPNRTSNFNTRQNGYDMSADALGYPESYYVPPAEAVEKIEVVRGAASLQYGPQFGGMLNYVLMTPPSNKKIEWTSLTTAGAYKLISSFNSLAGTYKKFSYCGYYNYKQGESWRPNAGYKLHTAFVSIGYKISDKVAINSEYTLSRYLTQQPGGLTDAQFNNSPRQSLRSRNWFSADWNILALKLHYKQNAFHQADVRWWGFIGSRNAAGYLAPANRTDDLSSNRDLIADKYINTGAEARYVWKYYLAQNLSAWLIGARFYYGQTKKIQSFTDNGAKANFNVLNDSLTSSDYTFPGMNVSVFSENVFNLFNKVKIVPGIRFEYIQTRASGYYRQTNGYSVLPEEHYEIRNFKRAFVLAGLGVSSNVWKQTELYANFSQNYRGITFTDMRVVRTSQIIDPNLKDETGFNADLGYRGQIKWFCFDVSGFWLQYNNRIGQVQIIDSAYNIFRYTTNVGKTRSVGAEIFLEADLLYAANYHTKAGNLVVFASIGYTNAVYVKSTISNVKGKLVEFAPPITLHGGITYRYKSFSTTLNVSYTHQQYTDATNAKFTPTGVNGLIPAYYVLDWSARYSIKCIQLSTGINNFTNNKYFTRRAVSYPGPGIIPAEPLTFYFTLGFKLNDLVKSTKWNTWS